jgi:hypothetical protein
MLRWLRCVGCWRQPFVAQDKLGSRTPNSFHGAEQVKFAASLVLPAPVYFAMAG